MNAPILSYPNFNFPMVVTTDASNVAIGAVLSQIIEGTEHPISFASRTLNDTEQKYSTIEKELLAIVYATKHFRPYLYGAKFTIQTDHKPLQCIPGRRIPYSTYSSNFRMVTRRQVVPSLDSPGNYYC